MAYPDHTVSYGYDAAYNRISERSVDAAGSTVLADKRYSYNNRNQLTDISDSANPAASVSYQYDANGNQTIKSKNGVVTTFVYSSRDKLVAVQEEATTLGLFRYDYQGLRIGKTGADGELRYTYDGDSVLLQSDAQGQTLAKYDYGPDQLLSLSHASEGRQYYHFDALGSVANLSREDGTLQARYQYDAWGNLRDNAGQSWNAFGFTGHERDGETGLYYFKARFYDPDTGRFLSQDSYLGEIDTAPSLHRYLYAYGNPGVYVDLDGYASVFRDASNEIDEFKAYLDGKMSQYDSGTASGVAGTVATSTTKFVAGLGQGILLPLDYIANGYQQIAGAVTGVDYSEASRDIRDTHKAIGKAYDYVMDGGLVTSAKNAVNDAQEAITTGRTDAVSRTTQTVWGVLTLREAFRGALKGKPKAVEESASKPGANISADTSGINPELRMRTESMLHTRGQRVNPGERALTKYEYKRINRELRRNNVGENTRDWVIRNVSENFAEHSSVKVVKTSRERSFWRRWGGEKKARERGAYGTSGPRTPEYTNKKLAVNKDWNDMTEQTRFRIKKGSVIVEGKAGPKVDVDGTPLPGGGHQILNIDLDNLIKK